MVPTPPLTLEPSETICEALARRVEELCDDRPGVPLRELVEVALAMPERAAVVARVVRTTTTRSAIVWVDPGRPSAAGELRHLTRREREVALLVAEGARNREIAERLGIAEATVKDHVHRALCKLGCESRTELARMLLQSESP